MHDIFHTIKQFQKINNKIEKKMKSSPNPVGWTNDNDQNESSPMSIIERETKTQRANTNQ